MGVAHVKWLNSWVSTCSRNCRECVPCVEPSRRGRPLSITPAQRWACARAITIGGLDYVVDVKNPLSEHLSVVVRHALHEACYGSLEKQKKPLLMAKNVRCKLEFAQRVNVIKIKVSMIHIGWFLVMRLRWMDLVRWSHLGEGWRISTTSSSCESNYLAWSWCYFCLGGFTYCILV